MTKKDRSEIQNVDEQIEKLKEKRKKLAKGMDTKYILQLPMELKDELGEAAKYWKTHKAPLVRKGIIMVLSEYRIEKSSNEE